MRAASFTNRTWMVSTAAALGMLVLTACGSSGGSDVGNGLPQGSGPATDTSGNITGTRFYKSAANTGLHVGHLLLLNGNRLGHTRAGKMKSYFINP